MTERAPVKPSDFDHATRFPALDLEAWRAEASAALKGATIEKRLLTPLCEGVVMRPLYTEADEKASVSTASLPGEVPFLRGTRSLGHRLDPWEIVQELPYADPEEFNAALRDDLAHGQSAAVILFDAAGRRGLDPDRAPVADVGRGGTSIATMADLDHALSGIDLERVPLFLHAGAAALPSTALLLALLQRRGQDASRLRGSLGTDPIADALASGAPFDLERLHDDLSVLTAWAEQQACGVKTLTAWGARWHEAGASPVEELAWTIASAVETLRAMEARGIPPARAAARFLLGFGVGTQFLVEVAKLRAARLLWARVTEACGCPEAAGSVFILARTAGVNLSAIDSHTNILRTTTEALAAVWGGCDGLTVLPYDLPLGSRSEPARRLARNTHLMLREESRFDRVIDPAGGAWALESLTGDIAEQAWRLFREVEEEGGLGRLLETGRPQARVAEEAAGRRKAIATRREILVGVNQYPNPGEPAPNPKMPHLDSIRARRVEALRQHRQASAHAGSEGSLKRMAELGGQARARTASKPDPQIAGEEELVAAAAAAALRGATLGEIAAALHPVPGSRLVRFAPLAVHRLSSDFETLRMEVGKHHSASPRGEASPDVYLANLGPVAEYRPRLEFIRSFFALAGLRVEGDAQFDDPVRAAAAALESGAPAICIVSTDDRYPEAVPLVAAALKRGRPAARVLLAGLPSEAERAEEWRSAGVDEFIHLRCDAHAVLSALTGSLGGEP